MAGISLRIDGEPDGQKRPRVFFNRNAGRVIAWSPKSAWAQQVFAKAMLMRPKTALEGPLSIDLTFWLPRPKSRPKDAWHASRPDWDNLAKSTCDALTKARWWKDDSRIVCASVRKLYSTVSDGPGVKIDVEEIA